MSRSETYRRKPGAAKAVASFVPNIAKAIFKAHGFPSAALLTGWADIAGADLASFTRPDRIVWPRHRDSENNADQDGGNSPGPRRGATLVLRAEGPRAIEVQFMAAQLLDRLNSYFGYGAITELRILQAPLGKLRPAESARTAPRQSAEPLPVEGIENADLQQALGRLGARVKAG